MWAINRVYYSSSNVQRVLEITKRASAWSKGAWESQFKEGIAKFHGPFSGFLNVGDGSNEVFLRDMSETIKYRKSKSLRANELDFKTRRLLKVFGDDFEVDVHM